ncbi:hypothetical protein [Agromyces bauzanensis]
MDLTIDRNASTTALLRVQAKPPLRRGSAAVVVTAHVETITGGYEVITTTPLEASLSADALPPALGVSAVLVIPGIAGVWAGLAVWTRDRRRLGIRTPNAGSQLWDNKLWLLAAGAVSVAVALIATWTGIARLFDTYSILDIAWVALLTGAAGAAVGWAFVAQHRQRIPLVSARSQPLDVARAAARSKASTLRDVYRTIDGKVGLFVHEDHDTVILSPQILMAEMTEVGRAVDDDKTLPDIIEMIEAIQGTPQLWFSPAEKFVERPGPAVGAVPTRERQKLFDYENPSEDSEGAAVAP